MPERNPDGEEPQVRPEVVQAVLSAIIDQDTARLEALARTGVTQTEFSQAENLVAASLQADQSQLDRQEEVWRVLGAREWPSPPTWGQLFDDLTPERARLGELYDALPDGARAEYDRRYGRPKEI
jgi:hypothetical protein